MFQTVRRVFSEGFRVFFLCAALFGMISGIAWGLYLGVHAAGGMWNDPPYAMAPHLWHGHEMIFGYAGAAIGGFFLTAVPNWTGAPGARTAFIAAAALIWIGGRLAMWWSGALPGWAVAAVDLAFVPVLAAKIVGQLRRRPKPQNLIFLLFLLALWLANLVAHLDWTGVAPGMAETGLRAGVLTLCGLIAVLGGRITPAFTRNAMKRAGLPEARWPVARPALDRVATVMALGLPWLALLPATSGRAAGAAALGLGAVQAARMARWRGRWTWNRPILWSLHAALAVLALGLVLWGAAQWGQGSEVAALHLLGVGCVGTMTLAVMSRATLGHAGRALVAPGPVAAAYALMLLAALLRWLGSALAGERYFTLMLGSVTLWSLAFALFLAALWPVLTGPRPARGG